MTHLEKLKDLVYKENRKVSIRDICNHLNVHVSEARRILDDFVSEEKNKENGKFNVTYIVTGTGLDSTDDYKVHKLTYAKCDELDEVKKRFSNVASCKVFSISLNDEENTLKEEKEPLLDRDRLLQQQRLTYIVNDDILLRSDRLERLKLTPGISVKGSNGEADIEVKIEKKTESVKESKTETKKETKSSSKRTTANRRNNKNNKQSKLSGFGTKIPKNEKTNSSGDSGLSMESTPDPFSEEEDEEKSPEREEEEMEVEPSLPSPSPPPSPEVKEESEDEAIVMEEVKRKAKKESKKRKRVMVYDSDEDEDALAMRILAGGDEENSNHIEATPETIKESDDEKPAKKSKKKSKPSQPMEAKTVPEEYVDEDGYTQVRMVKKMIPVEEKVEKSKSEDTGENEDKVKPQTKLSNKKPRTEEDREDKEDKPKSKKLSKAAQAKKGLVSITSFFKPVNT